METASVSAEPEPVIEEDGAGWATLTEMPDDPAARRLLQAHVDWCARRYRSYQPADNSYSPYSGGRRACFSPYIAEFAAITGAPIEADPHVRFVPRPSVSAAPGAETVVDEAAPAVEEPTIVRVETRGITSDEVFEVREIEVADEPRRRPILDRLFGQRRIEAKDCSHYRTYDPATNTYQPYGGGPRRVCG
ncbi:MAG: BA14K family protein [Rhizobiaceae bacterium]|nr:BA14K family protein [Rhizobiaceae bacterium]